MADGWYALISFAVGFLAAVQGVYERFRTDSPKASRTFLGFLYLLSRGAIASLVFVAVSTTAFLSDHPIWRALICGTGAEALLRSRFYVKRIEKSGENFEDLIRGPLDLLRWYQDLFLTTIENRFVKDLIRRVEGIAARRKSFLQMCDLFDQRINGWPQERPEVVEVRKAVSNLRAKFEEDVRKAGGCVDATLDMKYRHLLCYIVEDHLNGHGLETMFGNSIA